jgi:hypothetical protein
VKRFLQELEVCMAAMSPSDRAELSDAYRKLVAAVASSSLTIGGKFRPSSGAVLGLLMSLGSVLKTGPKFVADLKQLAPKIGPHVAALVQAL